MLQKFLTAIAGLLLSAVIPTVWSAMGYSFTTPKGWGIITVAALAATVAIGATLSMDYFKSGSGGPTRLRPQRKWIALKDAPFVLHDIPSIAKRRSLTSKSSLNDLLAGGFIDSPPQYPGAKRNLARPELRNTRGHDFVACGVDWEERRFFWDWAFELRGKWRTGGFATHPWDLDTATHQLQFVDESVWKQLKSKAGFVWTLMTGPLDELIDDGSLVVWGRLGSTFSPFRRVPADSWRHFEVTDWRRGIAKAVGGEVLYSVHLAPVR